MNLHCKLSDEHRDFHTRPDCDIGLLTEVHSDVELKDCEPVATKARTPKGGPCSAILSLGPPIW